MYPVRSHGSITKVIFDPVTFPKSLVSDAILITYIFSDGQETKSLRQKFEHKTSSPDIQMDTHHSLNTSYHGSLSTRLTTSDCTLFIEFIDEDMNPKLRFHLHVNSEDEKASNALESRDIELSKYIASLQKNPEKIHWFLARKLQDFDDNSKSLISGDVTFYQELHSALQFLLHEIITHAIKHDPEFKNWRASLSDPSETAISYH